MSPNARPRPDRRRDAEVVPGLRHVRHRRRALPDIRDGLKPVHRRVLLSMSVIGVAWNRPYKKSARIVGDCMGIVPSPRRCPYLTSARAHGAGVLAPVIHRGTVKGISAPSTAIRRRAMRYTEARLAKIAHDAGDIDRIRSTSSRTMRDEQEPMSCHADPNLLVNGSSGIAVGMATNIPPHNLTEVVDGLIMLIENPDTTVDDLMKVIPAGLPDAGFIYGRTGIRDLYDRAGIITLRARFTKKASGAAARRSSSRSSRTVNKATLMEKDRRADP